MKKLHLLCNAHLDPAWLWRWNDGLAEAISTFRVAADFCEEFDGFVFNHNEALLYEWIEEHEPELFARIQKLVAEGKWAIMGGWYLQPDCVMPSGESLLSQIWLGREYFEEKFGVKPTTAINFDPFGHSRGLVQILNKTGYDSYIFMRPKGFTGDFLWEGFDGSRILGHGLVSSYGSGKGQAVEKVEDYLAQEQCDIGICLWGVGNHGGGPSRTDLQNLSRMIDNSDMEIVHSTAEGYIREVNRDNLPVVAASLVPSMVGCYTSMARIKQANRRLESKIAMTEKILWYAELSEETDALREAKKALAFCQFHDILPGSGIRNVEEDGLMRMSYGEDIADKLFTKGTIKLCAGQKKAKDGEIPIMVFNPHPYEVTGVFDIGFMLQNQNWNEGEQTLIRVFDEGGVPVPCQNEKPDCTFNLDWIEKVSFIGTLAPSSVTRFDCQLQVVDKSTLRKGVYDTDVLCVENERMTVRISRKTGLIETYAVDGKTYIKNSGVLEVYRDNEDPWGMKVTSFEQLEGSFQLMSDESVNEWIGYPEEASPNVRVTEDGDVRMKVQAFFFYKRNVAVVTYTIPRQGTNLDVDITMYSMEPNKMIKYRLDTALSGTPWGETAFGAQPLFANGQEDVYHKWCGIREEKDAVYVLNKGTYGGSFSNSTLKLSLLRTAVYAAHPIIDRQIAPHDRFLEHIDMGERHFSFRITAEKEVGRQAQIYHEQPFAFSFFPSGGGKRQDSRIFIDNPEVLLSSVRKCNDGYELCIYNASEKENAATVTVQNKIVSLYLKQHEFQMVKI